MKGASRRYLSELDIVQTFILPGIGAAALSDKTSADFPKPLADIERFIPDVVFGWRAARQTAFVYMGQPPEVSPTMINLNMNSEQSLSQVDIFEAPPPIVIGKPVCPLELILFHDYDTTEKVLDKLW